MAVELALVIDTSIHEIEAVKRVSYALSDRLAIRLDRVDDRSIRATCCAKIGDIPPDLSAKFEEMLIDYGIRLTLARETADIRDLIYRQAFIEADF